MKHFYTHWREIPPQARAILSVRLSLVVGTLVTGWGLWPAIADGFDFRQSMIRFAGLTVVFACLVWLSIVGFLRHLAVARRIGGSYVVRYSGLIWAIGTCSGGAAVFAYGTASRNELPLVSNGFAQQYVISALILLPILLAFGNLWRQTVHEAIGINEERPPGA
jgi:hypothetical protein